MASSSDITKRWVEQVGTEDPRYLRPRSNIVVGNDSPHAIIYSYGSHFPLAMLIGTRSDGFFLLNSTRYSHTTTGHQSDVRQAIERTGIQPRAM